MESDEELRLRAKQYPPRSLNIASRRSFINSRQHGGSVAQLTGELVPAPEANLSQVADFRVRQSREQRMRQLRPRQRSQPILIRSDRPRWRWKQPVAWPQARDEMGCSIVEAGVIGGSVRRAGGGRH